MASPIQTVEYSSYCQFQGSKVDGLCLWLHQRYWPCKYLK
ncbi:Uncharacterised protein [Vibrio cholerae]|nr:Uncharacterised protein [Vibrio cholerae]